MEFKTPGQISLEKKGVDIELPQMQAACDRARQVIAVALGEWTEASGVVEAQLELSNAEWNAIKNIVEAELQESGWAITASSYGSAMQVVPGNDSQRVARLDREQKCIRITIASLEAIKPKTAELLRIRAIQVAIGIAGALTLHGLYFHRIQLAQIAKAVWKAFSS